MVVATTIGAALAQGRPPQKTELVLAAWAATQAVLTVVASAIHYWLQPPQSQPPDNELAGPWDPRVWRGK
jgi:hypothetical protein